MAKEDLLLQEEMGRLEIEPITLNRSRNYENPFVSHSKRGLLKRTSTQHSSCSCIHNKKNINNGICKRKNNKILKEPVLQILKTCVGHNTDRDECQQKTITSAHPIINLDSLNLCTLVKNCNQLKISNDSHKQIKNKSANDKAKWWKNDAICLGENREHKYNPTSQQGSCSQQALNPPCDVTIDELASYFETLVHIPKKMSSMAEMMYI